MKVSFERRVILSFELTIYGRRVRENIHVCRIIVVNLSVKFEKKIVES